VKEPRLLRKRYNKFTCLCQDSRESNHACHEGRAGALVRSYSAKSLDEFMAGHTVMCGENPVVEVSDGGIEGSQEGLYNCHKTGESGEWRKRRRRLS